MHVLLRDDHNFAAGEVDYALEARIVDKPELMGGATAREIADFTAAVVPLKISGPLTSPRIGIDIEGMLRREVDRAVEKEVERIKDRLLESVFGSADSGEEATAEADAETEAVEENPEGKKKKKKKSDRDKLKDALKDLIGC